jgi:hypothetical protein
VSAQRSPRHLPASVPSSVFTELEGLDLAAARERWLEVFGSPAPVSFYRSKLVRGIAWRLQVLAYGDISPAVHQDLRMAAARARAARAAPAPPPAIPAASPLLKPGTRLVKIWRGVTYVVDIEDGGVRWEGQRYGSLSAAAKAITGTHWNGLIFFGLRDRASYGSQDAARARHSLTSRRRAHG